MNTCGDCPRWPAAGSRSSQALERAFAKQKPERASAGRTLERVFAWVLSGGRHLELWNAGALTCIGGNGLTRLCLWRATAHQFGRWDYGPRKRALRPKAQAQPSTRGVRGFDSAELPQADKAAELHSHQAPRAP
jgi:hypothetical protein